MYDPSDFNHLNCATENLNYTETYITLLGVTICVILLIYLRGKLV